MGNVLVGRHRPGARAPGRDLRGLPNTVPATTVSKVCGSGLQAVIFGAKTLALGDADIVVAGGMESMSNVPYYLHEARSGLPHGQRHARRRDDPRRPLGPVLATCTWAPAATLCATRVQVLARGAGRVREGELPPRARRAEGRAVRRRDRGRQRPAEEGRRAPRQATTRGPRKGEPDEVRLAQARVLARTAPSPPPTPRRSTTAPARSSSPARRP